MSRGAVSGSYGVVGESSDRSIVGNDKVSAFSGSDHLRLDGSQRSAKRTRAINPGPGSFRLLAWARAAGRCRCRAVGGRARPIDEDDVQPRQSPGEGRPRLAGADSRRRRRGRGDRAQGRRRLPRGLPAVAPKSQVPSTGEHSRAVSWVAANFDRRDGFTWLGPAELRDDRRAWRVQRDDAPGICRISG